MSGDFFSSKSALFDRQTTVSGVVFHAEHEYVVYRAQKCLIRSRIKVKGQWVEIFFSSKSALFDRQTTVSEAVFHAEHEYAVCRAQKCIIRSLFKVKGQRVENSVFSKSALFDRQTTVSGVVFSRWKRICCLPSPKMPNKVTNLGERSTSGFFF